MTPLWFLVAALLLPLSIVLGQLLGRRNRELSRTPPPKRICANCQHFDLEEGQAAMARFPSFLRAAAALGPSEMGRKILRYDKHACAVCEATADPDHPDEFLPTDKTPDCHVCKGLGFIEQPVFEPTNLPAKARWEEFGACDELNQAVWRGDCCPSYVQLRVKP